MFDHSKYIANIKKKNIDELLYTIKDCRDAIKAMHDNPKAGQYQDEIHYCLGELKRRENKNIETKNDKIKRLESENKKLKLELKKAICS